jgi:hypothetical protein
VKNAIVVNMQAQPYHIQMNHKDARIEYVGKHLDSLYSGASSEETFFIKIPADRITKGRKSIRFTSCQEARLYKLRK